MFQALGTQKTPLSFSELAGQLGPNAIYLGNINGPWIREIASFPLHRLIDAVQSGQQSEDGDYRNRAKGFQRLGDYTEHNTKYYQQFRPDLPEVADQVALESGLLKATVSVIRQPPGNTIPWHQDQYFQLKKRLTPEEQSRSAIWRYLIFLEDWKAGHFFQVEQTPVVKWRAGDVITFEPHALHLSGNMGLEDKLTMQITGVDSASSWLHKAPSAETGARLGSAIRK